MILLLASATVFLDAALTTYRPSPWHLLGALTAVLFLVWAAKRHAGRLWDRLPSGRTLSPRAYAILGFAFIGGSFLLYGGGPFFGVVPVITIAEGAAVLVGVMLLIRRTSGRTDCDRQCFAFVAGVIGFLITLAGFLELAGWRGMGIVGAAFAYLMIRWYRRAGAAVVAEQAPTSDSVLAHNAESHVD